MRVPKISLLVCEAIKNLRDTTGSTAKEILRYIMSEHKASEREIKKQMLAAIKRGVDHGYLMEKRGHYSLNNDFSTPTKAREICGPCGRMMKPKRRRRRRSMCKPKRRRRRMSKCKTSRRSRSSRRGKSRRGRSRKRRSRRRMSRSRRRRGRSRHGRSRRSRKSMACCRPMRRKSKNRSVRKRRKSMRGRRCHQMHDMNRSRSSSKENEGEDQNMETLNTETKVAFDIPAVEVASRRSKSETKRVKSGPNSRDGSHTRSRAESQSGHRKSRAGSRSSNKVKTSSSNKSNEDYYIG